MNTNKSRFHNQARAAVIWALVCFLVGHLIYGVYLHRRHPEFYDPEFSFRLRDLKRRLSEAPDRPLALAVGSSRVAFGFHPASVSGPGAAGDREPILFNLAMLGVGPVRERLVLRRVLNEGIKPRWLIIEVWAPFLPHAGFFREEPNVFKHDVYWSDLPVLSRVYNRSGEAVNLLIEKNLTPALHYRARLLDRRARFLVPPAFVSEMAFDDVSWAGLDGFGWVPAPFPRPKPTEFTVLLERDKKLIKPLLDDFHVSEVSDQALRDLLDDCRVHDIEPVLLLMPEHSELRQWYAPKTRLTLTAYLRQLSDVYRTPVIDARTWVDDEDFGDCPHLEPHGADVFSERFGREVFRPLVQGRPLPQATLLDDAR
jgi:hypothetical protein